MKSLNGDKALDVERQSNSHARSIGWLSRRAVELAYASALDDINELAARLYCYNRIPISARSVRRFPDETSLLDFLGLNEIGMRGSTYTAINLDIADPPTRKKSDELSQFWRFWQIPNATRPESDSHVYKLYVSPLVNDLPQVLACTLKILPRCGACTAKLGRNLPGLLRPDKLLLYFARVEDAIDTGRELLSQLTLDEAHGVPFTFQIGGTSLVSLGVDLPVAQRIDPGRNRSWRSTVTHRLARIILDVRKKRRDDPIGQINAELHRSGIDPDQWKPVSNSWEFDRAEHVKASPWLN
jgi:hypothetical protein